VDIFVPKDAFDENETFGQDQTSNKLSMEK
jgi:hypothetical protein